MRRPHEPEVFYQPIRSRGRPRSTARIAALQHCSRSVVPGRPELSHVQRDLSEAYNATNQHPEIGDIEPHSAVLAITLPQ